MALQYNDYSKQSNVLTQIDELRLELFQLKRQFKDSLYNMDEGNFSQNYNDETKALKSRLNSLLGDVKNIKSQNIIRDGSLGFEKLALDAGANINILENEALTHRLDISSLQNRIDYYTRANYFEFINGIDIIHSLLNEYIAWAEHRAIQAENCNANKENKHGLNIGKFYLYKDNKGLILSKLI